MDMKCRNARNPPQKQTKRDKIRSNKQPSKIKLKNKKESSPTTIRVDRAPKCRKKLKKPKKMKENLVWEAKEGERSLWGLEKMRVEEEEWRNTWSLAKKLSKAMGYKSPRPCVTETRVEMARCQARRMTKKPSNKLPKLNPKSRKQQKNETHDMGLWPTVVGLTTHKRKISLETPHKRGLGKFHPPWLCTPLEIKKLQAQWNPRRGKEKIHLPTGVHPSRDWKISILGEPTAGKEKINFPWPCTPLKTKKTQAKWFPRPCDWKIQMPMAMDSLKPSQN